MILVSGCVVKDVPPVESVGGDDTISIPVADGSGTVDGIPPGPVADDGLEHEGQEPGPVAE